MANDIYDIITIMGGCENRLLQAHGYEWADELVRRIKRSTDRKVFVRKADVIGARGVEIATVV